MIFLGVNTGTSADAVDCVAFRFGSKGQQLLGGVSVDIHSELRQDILAAVELSTLDTEKLMSLRHQLTMVYSQSIQVLMEQLSLSVNQVTAIGLHGQTIHHRPDACYPYSLQIEDAHHLANIVGIDVVGQFRASDIAAGGLGAPLIPAYHQYCLNQAEKSTGIFLNLGGIANVTISSPSGVLGWDVGPANALMDLWVQKCLQKPFDQGGEWARSGQIIDDLLQQLMQDPYLQAGLPKSTGRDYFSTAWLNQFTLDQFTPEDIQATLCAFTVNSIQADLRQHAHQYAGAPIYVYGKGVKNKFMMEQLISALSDDWPVTTTEAIGIDPDWLECGLFAWLAFCHHTRTPVDLCKTTGALRPTVLGARVQQVR